MSILNKILANFDLYPDKAALFFKGNIITYRQLGVNTKQIAAYFQTRGVTGQCIAIDIDDSAKHISAILGVLLSGNYYLSITNENAHHIGEAFPLYIGYCLLSSNSGKRSAKYKTEVYLNETEQDSVFTPLDFTGRGEENFCAFITSGTGGVPKVIAHSYNNIDEDISRQIIENKTTSADRFDFVFSLSFSASLACIFPALVASAQLCIFSIKDEGMGNLAAFWHEQAITFSTLSVSTFTAVCKLNGSFHHLTSLRFLSLSAEPVNATTIEIFSAKFPESTLLQLAYATTETRTIAKIQLPDRRFVAAYNGSLGMPVANKKVSILSDDGNHLQPFEIGEITVESAFIAKRYEGNDAATSETFAIRGQLVICKTGDQGYLNDEGELFLKGRKGSEIKINGIKIDLLLIEQEIERIQHVTRVAVVINDSRSGKKSIVAFFQSDGTKISADYMNKCIADKMPQGHCPNFYCQLELFPQTHTGKVDRKKLERMDFVQLDDAEHEKATTASPTEDVILKVFNKVLNTTASTPITSFFNDLGGDSLESLIAIAELEAELKNKLPAYCIWAYQTPRKLAQFINGGINTNRARYVPINAPVQGRADVYFVNTFYGGDDYKFIAAKLSAHYNLVHLLYESENIENFEASHQLIKDLADIVTTQSKRSEAILLGLSFQGGVAQQVSLICEEVKYCVLLDTYNYFELPTYSQKRSRGMVIRTMLRNTLISGDYEILINFVKSRIVKQTSTVTKALPISGRGNGLLELWSKRIHTVFGEQRSMIPNNCLFFRATRTCVTHPTHGYNWKKYVKGSFRLINVKCNHLEITKEPHSQMIAGKIIEAIG